MADPIRSQLHQAARGLKAVRNLTSHAVVPAADDVVQCLMQVNQQLEGLCQQLKELESQHESACRSRESSITELTNAAQWSGHPAKSEKPSESAAGLSATTQQPRGHEPDRDNPVPSNYSNPDDGPAPSLNSILARLNSPADTDTNPLKGQEIKSLSDEDLLGLEMLNMVSINAQTTKPPFQAKKITELPEIISPEPIPTPSAEVDVESVVAEPVEATVLPVATQTQQDSPQNSPSGKANTSAEALYESAMSGDDSLFSVESVRESAGEDAMSSLTAVALAASKPASQIDDESGVTEEGQDAFVRSNIKGPNMEKLESLRQRLQGIFANQSRGESSEPNNNPIADPVDPRSLISLVNGDQSDEEEMQINHETSNSPVNPFHVGQFPAQPVNNHPHNEDLNKKGGVPMQTIESTAGNQEKSGLMAGMATAAFLKDLNLEDEFSAPIQPAPMGPSAVSNQTASPAPVPAAVQESIKVESAAQGGDVDDYMKGLMNRLRGGSHSAPSQPASQSAQSQAANASTAKTEAKPTAPEQPKVEVIPLKDGEFVPLSEAPGIHLDIDALRDLANQSTRSAINVFAKHQKKTLYATQLAAVCGGVMGAVVFGALASSLGSMFYILAAGCVGISIFAGYKFFLANISTGRTARAR